MKEIHFQRIGRNPVINLQLRERNLMKFHRQVNHVSFDTNICISLINHVASGLKSTVCFSESEVSIIF